MTQRKGIEMKQAWILSFAVLALAGLAWVQAAPPPAAPVPAADPGTAKAMADLAAKTRASMAIIEFTLNDDLGGQDVSVRCTGVCVDVKGDKATLITTTLSPLVPPKAIKKVKILLPGVEKPLDAVYGATDPDPDRPITFVEVTSPTKWQPVRFAKNASAATVGRQVISVGLLDQWLGFEPYLGVGYVSARVRVPGPLICVGGGALTNVGSPVFTADGTPIGIVTAQQLPNIVSFAGAQGSAAMTNQRESACFLPVDDFVSVLENPPAQGKRLPWIGVLGYQNQRPDLVQLEVPAVRVGKVVPKSPAGRAGLKENETITGLNGQVLEKLATDDLIRLNFERTMNRIPVGSEVKLTLLGTPPRELTLKVESFPPTPREAPKYPSPTLGLLVRDKVGLDEALDPNPTATKPGLYVVGVSAGSPAAVAGLKGEPEWNLITKVDGQDVDTVAKFKELVEASLAKDPRRGIPMTVQKGALSENITVTPK
jgi:S1-C subfamily serine protease